MPLAADVAFRVRVRHAVLSLLGRPDEPNEHGVDMIDASFNRQSIKKGFKLPVDVDPPILRQTDRGVNLARPVARFRLPVAPGFFQFALLLEAMKTTFPRSMALIAGGKAATA